MKRRLVVILLASVLVLSLIAGCSGGSQQQAAPKEEPKPQTIKIGAILPLTGSAASTGVKLKYAIEVAQEIINNPHPEINLPLAKDAGLPNLKGAKVEFVFADHQANPEVAKSEAERLIQNEKVVGLIGCYHSSATKPASQVAERFQIPFVAGSSSSAALTERGLKWFTRIAPNDDMETKFFFDYLKYLNEKFNAGIKTVAVVYIDNEYGVHAFQMVDKWIKEYEKDGFKVVLDVKYPTNVSNVDTEVQKIKQAKPDAIFHASYIGDMTQFVKKYKELGVVPKAVLCYCGGFQDPQFVVNLGKDADYFSGSNACTSTLFGKMDALNKINELYKKKSGVDIDGPTLEDFASAMVIADAINQAGSTDPNKILDALKTKTFDAPYFVSGKIKFGPTGQNDFSASVMVQLQNGKYEAVWPEQFKTADPKPAFPKWEAR
ncbi:MAG TPA: ABC transporter substrate-binding protein [Firmicutes bacterium]|nr:ABC transporter substrate-binding protein [Bacillota bacterium]